MLNFFILFPFKPMRTAGRLAPETEWGEAIVDIWKSWEWSWPPEQTQTRHHVMVAGRHWVSNQQSFYELTAVKHSFPSWFSSGPLLFPRCFWVSSVIGVEDWLYDTPRACLERKWKISGWALPQVAATWRWFACSWMQWTSPAAGSTTRKFGSPENVDSSRSSLGEWIMWSTMSELGYIFDLHSQKGTSVPH